MKDLIQCMLYFKDGKTEQVNHNDDDFIDICDEFFGSIPRRILPKNVVAVSWESEEKDKKNLANLIQGSVTLNNGNKIDYITDNAQYDEAVVDLKKKRTLVFYNAMICGDEVASMEVRNNV